MDNSNISPKDIVDNVENLTYPQKAEVIRQMIIEEFPEQDSFVKKALILFGPKIILICAEKNYSTPGERVAQLLLESSKVDRNGNRVWSSLTMVHNNFGGVKALKNMRAIKMNTQEVLHGRRGTYRLKFAAFDNKWEGMNHYLKVVQLKRYKSAMKKHGREHFLALAKAGYCTEPAENYANMCMKFYNKYNLHKLNQILQTWKESNSQSTAQPLALAQ